MNQSLKAQQTNGFATAGLIVSMVSIFIPMMGLTGLLGVIFSIIGLVQSKKLSRVGRAYSILGIIIGILGIVYGIYYFVTALNEIQAKLNETYGLVIIK